MRLPDLKSRLSKSLLCLAGLLAFGLAVLSPGWASEPRTSSPSLPPELIVHMPKAKLMGTARLTFLGLEVYTARLWADPTVGKADLSKPAKNGQVALELQYAMGLKGANIAERSLQEMQKQAAVPPADRERWLPFMRRAFPDIARGDRLVGLLRPSSQTGPVLRFFFNGAAGAETDDEAFAERFLDIWLHPKTSEPAMRAALIAGLP